MDAHPRRWMALPVLCLAELIITIDNLIVSVTLPTFVRELGASTAQLQWIVDAYIVIFAGLLLTAGSLADRFGRRRVLIIGLVWLAGASLAASFATTPTHLIVARGVMGIGAALIFPTTLAAISDMFRDRKEKTIAIGIWSATTGVGVAAGPILGGFLIEHYHWGSIFLVNLPVIAVAIAGTLWLVRESTDPDFGVTDPVGMVLSVVGLLAVVATIIEAPHAGWTSPLILGGFAFSTMIFVAFFAWEMRVAHPMLNLEFFGDRRFRGGNIAILTAQAMVFAYAFLGVQYLQFVLDLEPFRAGMSLLPFAAAVLVAAPAATIAASRYGYRLVVSSGMALTVAAALIASRLDVGSSLTELSIGMAIFGAGMGAVTGPGTEAVMSSLPERFAGVGSAVNDTTRELGAALGIAIGGSLAASAYVASVTAGFTGTAMPEEGRVAASESIGVANEVAEIAEADFGPEAGAWVSSVADAAFMDGFSASMLGIAAIGAVASVAVVFTLPRRRDMSDRPMTVSPRGLASDGTSPGVDAVESVFPTA